MRIQDSLNKITSNKLLIKKNIYTLIIGETPSKGARSPKLWNKVYKKLNKKLKMYPADVLVHSFTKLMNYLKNDSLFLGAAITTPFKEKILSHVNNKNDEIRKIGSINTIKKKGKDLLGFNTDYFGATKSLKDYKNKKNILILGCGGAGKAVILGCIKKFRNSFFYFYNRDEKKLKKFLLKLKLKNFKILNHSNILDIKNIDLVVNTTSIGFDSWIKRKKIYYNLIFFTPFFNHKKIKGIYKKDKKKFYKKNKELISEDATKFKNFLIRNSKSDIFDIIYNPNETKLIKLAKSKGHKTQNGLYMNLYQAVKGFCIVNNINHEYIVKKIMIKKNG